MKIINDCAEYLKSLGVELPDGRITALLSQAIGENYYIPNKKLCKLLGKNEEYVNYERSLIFFSKPTMRRLLEPFKMVVEFVLANDLKYNIRKYKDMLPADEFDLVKACKISKTKLGYARIAREIAGFCAFTLKSYGVHDLQIAGVLGVSRPTAVNIRLIHCGGDAELKKRIELEYTPYIEKFHANAKYCKVDMAKSAAIAEKFAQLRAEKEAAAKLNALRHARLVAQFPPLPEEKKTESFKIESILRPEYANYLQA